MRPLENGLFQVLPAPSNVSGEPTALFCESCGAANNPGTGFCLHCNSSLSDASALDILPLPRLLKDRYLLVSCLGRGGMGIVYKARDTRFGNRPVAIKERSVVGLPSAFNKTTEEYFEQEGRFLAEFLHPALPRPYEYFVEDGRQYWVLDFIEGKTLSDYLTTNASNPLSLKQVLDWGLQICRALEYLHNRQPPIVFRDISTTVPHRRLKPRRGRKPRREGIPAGCETTGPL